MAGPLTMPQITPTASEFAAVFPFHIAFDRQGTIVQFGRNLAKVCPGIAVGRPLQDFLAVRRPEIPCNWDAIRSRANALFLLECRSGASLLRGQMLPMADETVMMFLGSPWFTSADEVIQAGLGFDDFAIHDPGMDMLLVMQAQNSSLAELKDLADRLGRQRSELRATNEKLVTQNAALQATQAALQRSEADARLLGLVAARTNNGVVITDGQGHVVWVNAGFTQITGYTLDDIRGRKPGHFLQGPATAPETIDYMRHQLAQQKGFTTEVLNFAKNGRPYWLAIEVQPVRNDAGELTHYLAIETDITQRREAEEALRAETDLLTTTLASIVDGVIVVTPEARIQILNPAAEALTGWPLNLAEGRPLSEVFHLTAEDGSPAPDLLDQALTQLSEVGNIHKTDHRFLLHAPNRAPRLVVAAARPMLRDGQTQVGGLLVFRDVTTELEADEMKRDFVYAVSHELRTPLTSLRGFLSTILGDPDMPPDTRHEFTQIAHDQALRLSHLVEDILEISRIESGQITDETEPVDLEATARACLQEIAPLAVRKSIRVATDIAGPLPPVNGAPERVRSIFSNLLANAVKFTPDGGRVQLTLRPSESGLELRVQDSGIGIPADQVDRIFQRFYRVRRPGLQIAGTGLGLSIVQSVVERMGGRIEVESQVDRGTCFKVTFPTGASALPPAPSPTHPS